MGSQIENEPLLYIDQPNLEKPQTVMQIQYFSDDLSQKTNDEKEEVITGKNTFNKMPTDEQINYLLNFPKNVVQLKCEIKTAKETLRGIVEERQNDTIEIKDLNHSRKRILINDIEEIRLIGL